MRTNQPVPIVRNLFLSVLRTHFSADKAEPKPDQSYGKLKALLAVGLECVDEEVKLKGVNKKANPIYLIWQPVWGNS
jgi:hypothetical protein